MAGEPRVICGSDALAEGGLGVRFDWAPAGGQGKGFVVRHEGAARAFVNRCPHMGVELDWLPGEFFDETGLYFVCSTHGAIFEPATGLCVAGALPRRPAQGDRCRGAPRRILIHD